MSTVVGIIVILVIAVLIIHMRPGFGFGFDLDPYPTAVTTEGFTTVSIHPTLSPQCVSRSTDAQKLLARVASASSGTGTEGTSAEADELRLLVSKLCCMEADIAAPSAGVYRTMGLQFRTSQDMEPPSTIVGRCLRNAVNSRDIDLIIEKYKQRGHVLLKKLQLPNTNSAIEEFDNVVTRLQFAMTSFCLKPSPSMDHPIGARDMGFWEPEDVADLSQYQGISAVPK